MNRPALLKITSATLLCAAGFFNAACERPAAASVSAPVSPGITPGAVPLAERVTLSLQGAGGPGSLTVVVKEGSVIPAGWRPAWTAVNGPFVATGGKNEYMAPLSLDLPAVLSWNNPPPAGPMLVWPERFSAPQSYTIVTAPEKPAWPLQLQYDLQHRSRQVPLPYPIDPDKSLLVTGTDSVNDPVRTWEPSLPKQGNPEGVWTFHHLLSSIANQKETGMDPGTLARQWMESFAVDQHPDGSTGGVAPARNAQLIQQVLTDWPKQKDSNTLDTTQSPFRLLAIVNRIDLRLGSAYGRVADDHRAELRFVFCYVEQPGEPQPGMQRDFLVIFEFGVSLPNYAAAHQYALDWAHLSDPALTDDRRREALAQITEKIVSAGAGKGFPNGSNLNHLRTEDLYFAPTNESWDLRQFVIDPATHGFKVETLDMTPDFSWTEPQNPDFVAGTAAMRTWIQANAAAIHGGVYDLPVQLTISPGPPPVNRRARGAAALGGTQDWFHYPDTVPCDPVARLGFIQNTCNGCHSYGNNTPTNEPDWQFTYTRHLMGRPAAQAATPSDFLENQEIPQRLQILRSLAESDPKLPLEEFFQRQLTKVH